MKLTLILMAWVLLGLTACTDTKKQEKDALSSVIKKHDEAMAYDGELMKNKVTLDSLAKTATPAQQPQITAAINKLSAADKDMEDWMHQFNADNTGKSHEEIMQYLAAQQKLIDRVNKQLGEAVNQSTQLLSTNQP
jgi:hypothetical protein